MARKTAEITIGEDGARDAGKTFILTELPAAQAARWARKALNGMARANVEIPDTVAGAGIVGVWVMGIKQLFAMDFATQEELHDEMLSCVAIRPDANNPTFTRPIIGPQSLSGDIEEPLTFRTLYEEVFRLHVNFTPAELLQRLISVLTPSDSSSTETSTG